MAQSYHIAVPRWESIPAHISNEVSCWVEISLAALRHNFCQIRNSVPPGTEVCVVVKADAYGHGAIACGLALQAEGAKWFAVSTASEGIALRDAGVQGRILLLNGSWAGEEQQIISNGLTPAVWRPDQVKSLEKVASGIHRSNAVKVHLKINTGLNRLGLDENDVEAMLQALESVPHVQVEGVFSHFACAETPEFPGNRLQLGLFQHSLARLAQSGIHPAVVHIANSSALLNHPEAWFNLVRSGIALYGYSQSAASPGHQTQAALRSTPVLTWKTRVIHTRTVEAGQGIGYGAAYVTAAPARIAVLSVGYHDGLDRKLASGGRVIVHDHYAPIVGNVSMNLTTIDVTGIPRVAVGDEVILLGRSPHAEITAWEHAKLRSTIPYEVLCGVSGQLPRRYID